MITPLCEICDTPGAEPGWPRGVIAHRRCVPSHWRTDRDNRETFGRLVAQWKRDRERFRHDEAPDRF